MWPVVQAVALFAVSVTLLLLLCVFVAVPPAGGKTGNKKTDGVKVSARRRA